jgi:hypothetical protein
MGSTYILRKGDATLSDLKDGQITPQITGNIYYAIQDSEAFYSVFRDTYQMTYPDGTEKVHTTIQGAIDATTANRGDIVYVIGEWTSAVTITMNKWGTSLIGATAWNSITGGGNANITCTGDAIATITVTKAKTHIENLVIYCNGTGATKGIEWTSSAPSQQVVRNVEIVKNGGDADVTIGMHFNTTPTRGEFSNIKITGAANNTNQLGTGIEGGGYSNVFRDIVISNCHYGIIADTYGDLYQRVLIMNTCAHGMDIYGTGAAQSMIVDCRNAAVAKGTLTNTIIVASYTTGLTELTA